MRYASILGLLVLAVAAAGRAQQAPIGKTPVASFTVGGVSVAVPSPAPEMTQIPRDKRHLLEVLVPAGGRLIAAFVPATEAASGNLTMRRYAFVQTQVNVEKVDFGVEQFRSLKDVADKENGKFSEASLKMARETLRDRNIPVTIGKPVRLGRFFSTDDAYGFGLVIDGSANGKTARMGVGTAMVLVKKRLIFVYLYAAYEGDETLQWLRRTTQEWVEAVRSANHN